MTVGRKTPNTGNALFTTNWPPNREIVVPSDAIVYDHGVALLIWAAGNVVATPLGTDSAADITLVVTSAMVANGPYDPQSMFRAVKATGTTVAAGMIEARW